MEITGDTEIHNEHNEQLLEPVTRLGSSLMVHRGIIHT